MQARRARFHHVLTAAVCGLLFISGCTSGAHPDKRSPSVLLVCNGSTARCPAGPHFRTVQEAVSAARPGQWVLIWPGVYHENDPAHHAGVWITTARLHIRGLSRDGVIIDGSRAPADDPCPSSPALQDYTPRDGIVVWRASGVSIQNLTVCNYLAGRGAQHGTQIWWANGDDSRTLTSSSDSPADTAGLGAFTGSYLTATSMYHPADIHSQHLAEFGIFARGAHGPGVIADSYAANMANAAFYVGACGRSCNTVLTRDHGTGSAIGYLGTNSGGRLTVESSVFDRNRTGVVLLSLNTDDLPPPQDGRCPAAAVASCTLLERNQVLNNDNANAPLLGISPAVGTGIEISGGSFDTVTGNIISGNGSWGVLVNDNIDHLSVQQNSHCQGGTPNAPAAGSCLFAATGNRIFANTFQRNGGFRNPTNSDLAVLSLAAVPPAPRNCFFGNHSVNGPLTSSPASIQERATDGEPCNLPGTPYDVKLLHQLNCAATGHCDIAHPRYPGQATIAYTPVPQLQGMPDPCVSVPSNRYCLLFSRHSVLPEGPDR